MQGGEMNIYIYKIFKEVYLKNNFNCMMTIRPLSAIQFNDAVIVGR